MLRENHSNNGPNPRTPFNTACGNENMCIRRRRAPEIASEILLNWHVFGQKTTIHGISHLYQTQDRSRKIFWIFLTVFGFVMTSVHLYFHTSNFMSSPFATVIKHQTEDFHFPDVTFCALSPTNKHIYSRVDFAQTRQGLTREDFILLGLLNNIDNFRKLKNDAKYDLLAHRRTIYLQRATYSTYNRSFYPYNELIISCSFKGKPCKPENIILTENANYWNCYTFRIKNLEDRIMSSTKPDTGLSMVLYTGGKSVDEIPHKTDADKSGKQEIEPPLNAETLTKKLETHNDSMGNEFYSRILLDEQEPSGLKLTIHSNYSIPVPAAQGFVIGSGLYAKIGVHMTEDKRMNRYDSPCEPGNKYSEYIEKIELPSNFKKNDSYLENVRFTTKTHQTSSYDCQLQAYQAYIYKECGCISHILPILATEKRPICYNYTTILHKVLSLNNYTYSTIPYDWLAGTERMDMTKKSPSHLSANNFIAFGMKMANINEQSKTLVTKFVNSLNCHDRTVKIAESKANLKHCETTELCETMRYSYFYSSGTFPRNFALGELMNNTILPNLLDKQGKFTGIAYSLLHIDPANESNWYTYESLIRENFAKVVIHPLSLKSDRHEEEETYNVWEALSELGGISGLWLGMSFLTCFEILDFMLDVLFVCHGPQNNKTRNNGLPPDLNRELLNDCNPEAYPINRQHEDADVTIHTDHNNTQIHSL